MIKYGIIKDFAKWNSNNMIKQNKGLKIKNRIF